MISHPLGARPTVEAEAEPEEDVTVAAVIADVVESVAHESEAHDETPKAHAKHTKPKKH